MRGAMRPLWRAALDLLLPRACARCGREGIGEAALCAACRGALPRLPPGLAPAPPAPLAAWCAEVAYRDEIETWIRRFKYPAPGLAGLDARPLALVESLARDAAARAAALRPLLVVPVPMHPRRLRARGLHPAGVLARVVARRLGVPFAPSALVAVRETQSQTGLDRAARRRNVRGAFAPSPGFAAPPVVALVDDVATTGATLCAAARALRRAGARRIVAICVARTL
ncbi:MAG TPA: phosphoribosyltransferase family protein [Myxococcota bacterium]